MIKTKNYISKSSFSNTLIATILVLSSFVFTSKPVKSVEQVKLIYGPFNGKVSLDLLKTYAKTGEKTGKFRMYSKFLDQEALTELRG